MTIYTDSKEPSLQDEESAAIEVGAVTKLTPSSPEKVLASTKHPLQHSWTLWYYKNDRTKSWEENLKEVIRHIELIF